MHQSECGCEFQSVIANSKPNQTKNAKKNKKKQKIKIRREYLDICSVLWLQNSLKSIEILLVEKCDDPKDRSNPLKIKSIQMESNKMRSIAFVTIIKDREKRPQFVSCLSLSLSVGPFISALAAFGTYIQILFVCIKKSISVCESVSVSVCVWTKNWTTALNTKRSAWAYNLTSKMFMLIK